MISMKETSHGTLGEGVQSFNVTGTPLSRTLTPQERFEFYMTFPALIKKIESIQSKEDYLVVIQIMKDIVAEYSLVREISPDE
jgi:hypothetical protein